MPFGVLISIVHPCTEKTKIHFSHLVVEGVSTKCTRSAQVSIVSFIFLFIFYCPPSFNPTSSSCGWHAEKLRKENLCCVKTFQDATPGHLFTCTKRSTARSSFIAFLASASVNQTKNERFAKKSLNHDHLGREVYVLDGKYPVDGRHEFLQCWTFDHDWESSSNIFRAQIKT